MVGVYEGRVDVCWRKETCMISGTEAVTSSTVLDPTCFHFTLQQ